MGGVLPNSWNKISSLISDHRATHILCFPRVGNKKGELIQESNRMLEILGDWGVFHIENP